jgi:small conductance mechanosensitive channel
MSQAQIEKYSEIAVELTMQYAPQFLLALFTLVFGLWAIKLVMRVVKKGLDSPAIDPTLAPFINSIVGWSLRLVLLISVASMVGVQTTSFVAVLGAAGLAVGLALQGSLSNFAGGVLILAFRPYKVGDLVEAQGQLGVVKEIQIFTTILLSPQNRRVIIPNGAIANGNIVNLSAEDHLRVDTTVGISYQADMKLAREVIMEAVTKVPGVLTEPAPLVAVSELGDSSVNLVVRPFCKPTDYWDVRFALVEATKNALDAAKISIPFPQRDVHLFQDK